METDHNFVKFLGDVVHVIFGITKICSIRFDIRAKYEIIIQIMNDVYNLDLLETTGEIVIKETILTDA